MITFIGIVVLLLALGSYITHKASGDIDEYNAGIQRHNTQEDQKVKAGEQSWANYKQPKTAFRYKFPIPTWAVVALGVLILFINGLFFWADAGKAYAIQYPWGGDKMVATQGLKVKAWGRTIPLSYEMSLQDIILQKDENGEVIERLPDSEDGIYNREAKKWEFADAIKADIATAVIVGVSIDDEEQFLTMADRNRSEGKLINGRVIPNIDAALKNTCKLIDAQDYISGKASDFDRYFRDQLENGMYQIEEYVVEDNTEIIGDTTTVRQVGKTTGNSKQKKFRIKLDSKGDPIRDTNSNTLTQYGIKIYQAQVTGIDWEDSFDKRLDLQKNEVAQIQLEKPGKPY